MQKQWNHPRGRWCLVAPCTRCGKFCRDTSTESLYGNSKWGTAVSKPPRTNGHWFYSNGLCDACAKIRFCELCGKEGTTSTIYRRDVFGWNFESPKDCTTKPKNVLCMSCWNKVRAIVRKRDATDEIRILLNKLTKAISDERKNQNNRRAS